MKKLKYSISALALLAMTAGGFVSCLRGGTLESITVTPVNPYMARGTTQQFTATARFSDGTTLDWTSASAWSSTSTTVATITDTPGLSGSGIVTANSITAATTDTTVITATDTANNISSSVTLTVGNPTSLEITPANPHMAINTSHQFTATALFSGATPTPTQNLTSFATWTTSPAGPTVSSTGLVSAGTSTGQFAIIAGHLISNVTATTTLTITSEVLSSLTVTPISVNISPGAKQQFNVTGNYPTLAPMDFTSSVTWNSSNTSVATIDNAGLAAAGTTTGPTTITATDPITNKSVQAILTVP